MGITGKDNKNINQSIQICRLIAAIFVVFIHVGFPGRLGTVIDCVARFAVPTFFAISGYFSYLADSSKIKKRIVYMIKLNLVAVAFYAFLNMCETKYIFGGSLMQYLNNTLNMNSIAKWIFINIEPIAGHLWYLAAILICYIFLWVYVKFFEKEKINYTPLYITSACALLIHVVLGANATAAGMDVPYHIYRNALFYALPMFSIGMFIHQYHERIIEKYNLNIWKEIIVIVLGLFFSLVQYVGIGKAEMPIGIIFVTVALMLLVVSHPIIPFLSKRKKFIASLSNISLIIYIIHPAIKWFYKYLHGKVEACVCENPYLNPLAVVGGSIICGIVFTILANVINKLRQLLDSKINKAYNKLKEIRNK